MANSMSANDRYQIKQHEDFMKETRKQKALDVAIALVRSGTTVEASHIVKEAAIIERYLAGSTKVSVAKKTKKAK